METCIYFDMTLQKKTKKNQHINKVKLICILHNLLIQRIKVNKFIYFYIYIVDMVNPLKLNNKIL